MREISKSDVSPNELRSVLLQSSDVPGWSIDPAYEPSAAESAIVSDLNDEFCDVNAVEESAWYTAASDDLTVFSTAEPVCGR